MARNGEGEKGAVNAAKTDHVELSEIRRPKSATRPAALARQRGEKKAEIRNWKARRFHLGRLQSTRFAWI